VVLEGRIAAAALRMQCSHGFRPAAVMTQCDFCHRTLVESYDAKVELLQNSEVRRTDSLVGLHFWCARDWVTAETERLRERYADARTSRCISREKSRAEEVCPKRVSSLPI
jgi:hypothetical protein